MVPGVGVGGGGRMMGGAWLGFWFWAGVAAVVLLVVAVVFVVLW